MSLGDFVPYGEAMVVTAAAILIGYRSLSLRGVLVDRPYRTRALWTAIGAFSLVAFFGAGFLDAFYPATSVEGVIVEAIAWGFVFLVVYGWVATSIEVAISADYFNRDALSWKRGGKIATIAALLVSYIAASLPPWWIPPQYQDPGATAITLVFFGVSVYSAIVLAITVRRIVDRSIRNYTKWVLISIVLLFGGVFTTGTSELGDLLGVALSVAWILSMNHSVTTLAIRTRALPT